MTRIYVPTSRDALQKAVDNSQPGQILVLPTEANYGPLVLPGRDLGVRIECADFDSRFGTMRRLPVSQELPCITSDSPGHWPVSCRFRTRNVQFAGVRIRNTRKDASDSQVTICVSIGKDGDVSTDASSIAHLPNRIAFEKCDIGGTPGTSNTLIGVLANGTEVSLSGCRITHVHHGRLEAQGVLITNTPGPVTIDECEIVASTENIMCGGSSPTIPRLLVCSRGLAVTNNHLHKLPEWRNKSVLVKNLFELKNCHSASITGNVMEHNWADGQNGMAVLLTPREHNPIMYSQNNTPRPAPLTRVGNVLFARNTLRNVDGGVNILAADDIRNPDGSRQRTQATGRLSFVRNRFENIGAYGSTGWVFSVSCNDVTKPVERMYLYQNHVRHGGVHYSDRISSSFLFFEGEGPAVRELYATLNDYTPGKYHVMGTGGAQNGAALAQWTQEALWRKNKALGAEGFEWSA